MATTREKETKGKCLPFCIVGVIQPAYVARYRASQHLREKNTWKKMRYLRQSSSVSPHIKIEMKKK
jgi:hypothetical protein